MATRTETTFTRQERRKQIVSATVRVIARDGLSAASFARIAAEAGLSSSGLISYHFASRDDLLGEVVAFVLADFEEARRVEETESALHDLDEMIDRSVRYVHEHHERIHALSRVLSGWKAPGEDAAFDLLGVAGPLEALLERGVRAGEMRPMRCDWVAQCIQRSVETLHDLRLGSRLPEVDAYATELRTVWRAATARPDEV